MLQFVRRHPILGLFLALSVEAWIALPGETLIGVAAASVASRAWAWTKLAASGLAGMAINDLALLGLSRAGRGLLGPAVGRLGGMGVAGAHLQGLRLDGIEMLGLQFLPPLRSAGYLIYGLQGSSLRQFVLVSIASSSVWMAVYMALGRNYQDGISRMMHLAEQRSRWVLATEIGLTVAGLVLVLQPLV